MVILDVSFPSTSHRGAVLQVLQINGRYTYGVSCAGIRPVTDSFVCSLSPYCSLLLSFLSKKLG
jgi:hypothetical protein